MKIELTKKELKVVLDFKNYMHKYPELSNQEIKTTKKIKEVLNKINVLKEIKLGLKTGCVYILDVLSNKTVALRADIDAIRQKEKANVKIKSLVANVMHACGHDAHAASLIGAAIILAKNKKFLKTNVIFIFQPAEETTIGANIIIKTNLFKKYKIDMIFGLHNFPGENAEKIIVKKGFLMSSKINFQINVYGIGTHGSMQYKGSNPIVCGSSIILGLQSIITKNKDPFVSSVLNVNYIKGGSEKNLVVNKLKMNLTLRCLESKNINKLFKNIKDIVKGISIAYGCKADIKIYEIIPSVYNNSFMYKKALKISKNILKKENIITEFSPVLASEDFAMYAKETQAFMYFIGSGYKKCKNYSWHDKNFKVNDKCIEIGAKILASSVIYSN